MYKEYKDNLDLKEVLTQLLKNDSDSCELTYTHGDLVFSIDLTITKIVKNGKVEYDIEGEMVNKDELIENQRQGDHFVEQIEEIAETYGVEVEE